MSLSHNNNIPQHVLRHWITIFVWKSLKGFSKPTWIPISRNIQAGTLFLSLTPLPVKSLNFQMNFFKTKFSILISSLSETWISGSIHKSRQVSSSKLDPVFYSSTPPQREIYGAISQPPSHEEPGDVMSVWLYFTLNKGWNWALLSPSRLPHLMRKGLTITLKDSLLFMLLWEGLVE